MAKTVDDFSDGDLTEYEGDKTAYEESNNRLRRDEIQSTPRIVSTSGLPNYPTLGDVYAVEMGSFEGDGSYDTPEAMFGVQGVNEAWLMTLDPPSDEIRIRDATNGTETGDPEDIAVINDTDLSLDRYYDCRLFLGATAGEDKSLILYEEGEAVVVGDHGENDFVYVEGEPVTDSNDAESIAYEAGTPLGGSLNLDFKFELHDSPSSETPLESVNATLPDFDSGGIGWRAANSSGSGAQYRNARIL